jgi:hypothetical protein
MNVYLKFFFHQVTYLDYICHTLRMEDELSGFVWDMNETHILMLDGDVGFTHKDVKQVLSLL